MHTPGPWKWASLDVSMATLGTRDGIGDVDFANEVLSVSRCRSCQTDPDRLRCMMPNKDDANLIEAAPELLHACKLVVEACGDMSMVDGLKKLSAAMPIINAAVDHAEGRTS